MQNIRHVENQVWCSKKNLCAHVCPRKKGPLLGPGMKSATRASGIVIIVNHSECFWHCFDDSSGPYANEIMINVSTMVNGWPSVKDGGLAIDGH